MNQTGLLIVLVHGVPETAALWDPVRVHLPADTLAVQLPGFGCPRPEASRRRPTPKPAGSSAGSHNSGARSTWSGTTGAPPSPIGSRRSAPTSWAADAAYLLHPDYEWHDLARTWQTADAGEAFWAGYLASPVDQVAAAFEPWGVDHDDALTLAAMADSTMARCVLDLYRAATPNPHSLAVPQDDQLPTRRRDESRRHESVPAEARIERGAIIG